MTKRDLKAGLLDAEHVYQRQAPSPEAEQRMQERLFGPAAGRTRRWWVASAAAVAALGVAFFIWNAGQLIHLDDFEVSNASADLRANVDATRMVQVSAGQCELLDRKEGERIAVRGPVLLRKEATGLRVLTGILTFSVEKRPTGASPARVLVSHGVIEILGTRFTIRQEEGRGSVRLDEGTIRFSAQDGTSRTLLGSGELSWPIPPVAPQAHLPFTPTPPRIPDLPSLRPSPRFTSSDELLQQVDVLRSRGRYEEAVLYLKAGLASELPKESRERFSYEIGSILTRQLADRQRACQHWREHLRQYHHGRYTREVRRAMEDSRCGER